jgi:Mg2+-importing ATPase
LRKRFGKWFDNTQFGQWLHDYHNRNFSQLQSSEAKSSAFLADCANLSTFECLARFQSSLDGLVDHQISDLFKQYGPNILTAAKSRRWWSILLECVPNPFNVLLSILAIISVATQQRATFVILMVMVFLSTGLRFWQEMKSNRAANELKLLVRDDVTVIRNGIDTVVQKPHIFPGDLVRLTGGDILPADIVLVNTAGMYVSQSTLTGENAPLLKQLVHDHAAPQSIFDCGNLCFAGTTVTSGSGIGLVVATGDGNPSCSSADKTPTSDLSPKASPKNKKLASSNVESGAFPTCLSRSC